MRPYVVKEIVAADGSVIERSEPTVVDRPVSKETSQMMRKLLEQVVEEGGGRNAYIEGYRIGGKTGTAQVYKDGVVSSETHIGSFIGFAPIDDPQVAVLVIVDEADKSSDFGSVTAAPFARDILEKTLNYLGISRSIKAGEEKLEKTAVPDVTGMKVSEAISILKKAGFQYALDRSGANVVDQLPAGGTEMAEKSIVMLYADGEIETEAGMFVEVPDVKGLSIAAAGRLLASSGLNMRINGSGVAAQQSPEAGEMTSPTVTVTVTFKTPYEPNE